MVSPLVSIVIVNWNYPQRIETCLRTLAITEDVLYEVVVVDNGSEPDTVERLRKARDEGKITTLVEEPVNHYFSEGNNIGVRHTNPESQYILILNSDVAFLRPDWLTKMVAWMEGTIKYWPSVWGDHPTQPDPGPRDIVSIGWSYDPQIEPGFCRQEGWCCLFRRSVWRDISPDFPYFYGFEEMVASTVRAGAKIGLLSQYSNYLVHREQGSGVTPYVPMAREPDIAGWYRDLRIETLDFTLGPNEHDSYLWW